MNKRIDDLLYQAGLTASGCWDELGTYEQEAIERFAKLLIIDLMQHIKDPTTYNRCVITTFDSSLAECVKVEIFKMIEKIYEVKETK